MFLKLRHIHRKASVLEPLFTFACNVKSFAIAIIFFSSFFSAAFLGKLAKVNFKFFSNYCFKRVWPGSGYWYDMLCAFKPCPLEIKSNSGLRREHLESSSSATENVTITTATIATKLDKVVTYHEGVPPIKSHDPLITWFSEITWQTKIIISPLPVAMAAKFGRMAAHLDWLLLMKLHDSLITCFARSLTK